MRILGISAFHRDAAAAVLVDGQPVAAAQEERHTRLSLDPAFPVRAIRASLFQAGLQARDLDRVVFYEKPLRKFERVLALHLRAFPKSSKSFPKSLFLWLGDRLWIKNRIATELGVDQERILFCEHQGSVAANAYFTSPFDDAAVLTIDDAGEWATSVYGRGKGDDLALDHEILYPHSLGLLASAITQFLGFVPGEDESLLESLAAHGEPRFAPIMGTLAPETDGLFELDKSAFRLDYDSEHLWSEELEKRLGPPRFSGEPLAIAGDDRRHADIAASLQQVLEERVLALAARVHRDVPADALCLGGELARNRRVLSRLLADGPFAQVHVPPSPAKSGAALGAALWAHHVVEKAGGERANSLSGLGDPIEDRAEPGAVTLDSAAAVETELAQRLGRGDLVGWARGRMEFGPHSFGNRSVLALASDTDACKKLLASTQRTESFRECRVSIPAERAADYLELPGNASAHVRAAQLAAVARDALREQASSAVSPDGTAWVHAVEQDADPELHALLTRIGKETGSPLLLHADLSLRGSPIVRNEAEAVDAWRRSGLDVLVAGERLYERHES